MKAVYLHYLFYHTLIDYSSTLVSTMSIILNSNLTREEVDGLQLKLATHTRKDQNCLLWTSTVDKDGYGIVRMMFRGKRQKVKAHRLSYFLNNNFPDMPPSLHVSHLCNVPNCTEPGHLSLETCQINTDRKRCHMNRYCNGHRGYRTCVIRRAVSKHHEFKNFKQFVLQIFPVLTTISCKVSLSPPEASDVLPGICMKRRNY